MTIQTRSVYLGIFPGAWTNVEVGTVLFEVEPNDPNDLGYALPREWKKIGSRRSLIKMEVISDDTIEVQTQYKTDRKFNPNGGVIWRWSKLETICIIEDDIPEKLPQIPVSFRFLRRKEIRWVE